MSKKYNIVKWPNQALETKALVVESFTEEVREIVRQMQDLMHRSNGIGLAANQIGVLKRILTIYIPYTKEDKQNQLDKCWWHDQKFTFINPVVVSHSNQKKRAYEGCLSFPEIFDYVPRFSAVTVKAYDEFGKEFVVEADGLFSICLQHEIDHLDGVIFINRMSRLKASMLKRKYLKQQNAPRKAAN